MAFALLRIGGPVASSNAAVQQTSPCPPPPAPVCTETEPCISLENGNICPPGAIEEVNTVALELPTGTLCPGATVGVVRTHRGRFTETVVDTDAVCHEDCRDRCAERCVDVPVQDCWQVCLRRCSNGACLEWETRCDATGYQNACGADCADQCAANWDAATTTTFFTAPCGFSINDVIQVRDSDGGQCGGTVRATRTLTGAGTVATNIALPLDPGTYDICINGNLIQTVTVEACPQPACAIQVPANVWQLMIGVDMDLAITIATSDGAGGTYTLTLHRYEDDSHTTTLPLPPFVTVDPSSVTVANSSSAGAILKATNPQPVNGQDHWPGLIIRATGPDDGSGQPIVCEAVVHVELVCKRDADCDDDDDCTMKVCDPLDREADLRGCVRTNNDGAPCDDGNACTTDDTCQDGVCVGASPPEICDNLQDDDCDLLIDCADADCQPARCNNPPRAACETDADCSSGGTCVCPDIRKDPSTIRFGPPGAGLDVFASHGHVVPGSSIDVMASQVIWLVTNDATGEIVYEGTLEPGDLSPNAKGTLFRYLDRDARLGHGVGRRAGIYRAKLHITRGGTSYGYKLQAYGAMAAAAGPRMSIQFYLGAPRRPFVHRDLWTGYSWGWKATGFD